MSARLVVARARGITIRETDTGNAERLIALFGKDLRFIVKWNAWASYDGRRWAVDDSTAPLRFARETSRVLVAEASDEVKTATARWLADPDNEVLVRAKKDAERFFVHAKNSQDERKLRAMLAIARADEAIALTHEKLDRDPFLLNVENGTIDLRSGMLRMHDRADLITKLAPVSFDPNAKAPLFDAFLLRAMGGSGELVEYMARVVGYALTGSTREHMLGFFFGGGANGKSTMLGLTHEMLGDYAGPAPRGMLFRSRSEKHPCDLASLHGLRFVTCAEIGDGEAFDEALVKDLTGGDPIKARRMNENFWSFVPTHKLFIAGNHKPTVRGDDEGIWRRLRLVPWTVTIAPEERDKQLPEKLRAELPGVLAWAVRGCVEWQANGLGDPLAVTAATSEYRREADVLGEFFGMHLTFDPDGRIPRKELRETYVQWCVDAGHEPMGAKRFNKRLESRAVKKTTKRSGLRVVDAWAGVRLATAEERATRQWGEGTVVCSDVVGPGSESTPPASARKSIQPETGHYEVPTAIQATSDDDERDAIRGFS